MDEIIRELTNELEGYGSIFEKEQKLLDVSYHIQFFQLFNIAANGERVV